MRAVRLISRAFREVAALEIWSKRNGGGRKLTIFSAPSARWTDGAEKSSFHLKTEPGTSYYIQSFITNIRSQPASLIVSTYNRPIFAINTQIVTKHATSLATLNDYEAGKILERARAYRMSKVSGLRKAMHILTDI